MTLNDLQCQTMSSLGRDSIALCTFLVPAVTDIDFISYAVSLLWVKLCYGILLRNVWAAELQCCS